LPNALPEHGDGDAPTCSLSCVVASAGNLWALRTPVRRAVGRHYRPGVDTEEDRRMLEPDELVRAGYDLAPGSLVVLQGPPRHLHLLPGTDPNIDTFWSPVGHRQA
jgi:hypothetical protein